MSEAADVLQSEIRCNSLFGRLFPLFGRQNSAVRQRRNFTSDSYKINSLSDQDRPAKARNQHFSLYFPSNRGSAPLSSDHQRGKFSRD